MSFIKKVALSLSAVGCVSAAQVAEKKEDKGDISWHIIRTDHTKEEIMKLWSSPKNRLVRPIDTSNQEMWLLYMANHLDLGGEKLSDLSDAIYQQDADAFEKHLMDARKNPKLLNSTNSLRIAPLHIAMLRKSNQFFFGLMNSPGIDLNAEDDGGYTPLDYAAWLKKDKVVEILLADKRIKVSDKMKSRVLLTTNHVIANLFIKHNKACHWEAFKGKPLLHLAASLNLEGFKKMVAMGVYDFPTLGRRVEHQASAYPLFFLELLKSPHFNAHVSLKSVGYIDVLSMIIKRETPICLLQGLVNHKSFDPKTLYNLGGVKSNALMLCLKDSRLMYLRFLVENTKIDILHGGVNSVLEKAYASSETKCYEYLRKYLAKKYPSYLKKFDDKKSAEAACILQ